MISVVDVVPVEDMALPVAVNAFSAPLPLSDGVDTDQLLEVKGDEFHASVVPEAVLVTGVSGNSVSTGTTNPSPL